MDEHEQSELKKARDKAKQKKKEEKEVECKIKSSCLKKRKKPKKKPKKCKSFDPMDFEYDEEREQNEQICQQRQKAKEQTTKELVSFLKDLIEADQRKKEIGKLEKAISPYVSEEELETIVYTQLSEEFLEEEIIEEDSEEQEEEFEGEYPPINKDAEGYVDMDEVKKKLEELQGEEEVDVEEEEEEFMEGDFTEWIQSEESFFIPEMQDASAQFNYYLERRKVVQKTPKNITEDLVQFMRIVIMGDNNLREVMKEKELVQFKKKQLDFMSMGMLIKRPKPCQCVKANKYKTGKKGKCKCKCCPKPKGYKPGMDCEDLEMTYNIRPNEFMLMLQVLMNTMEVIEEQDRLLQPPSTVPSEVISEISAPEVTEELSDHEEEEEEDDNADDDDDD